MKVNQPEDLVARIKRLENEVATLKRGSSLSGAVLSRGTVEVQTDTGQVLQRIGAIPWAGTTAYGAINFRANGTVAAIIFDTADGAGYWAFYDEQGNPCLSNDTVANQGLATPYLPYTATPWTQVLTAPEVTTLGTFDQMARISGHKQNPYIRAYLLTQADVGTTGEVQLAIGGVAITDAPTPIPDGANMYQTVDAPLPGDHMAIFSVDVEARRLTGAGSIRVGVAFSSGRQS